MFPLGVFCHQVAKNLATILDIYATYKSIYVDNLPAYMKVKLRIKKITILMPWSLLEYDLWLESPFIPVFIESCPFKNTASVRFIRAQKQRTVRYRRNICEEHDLEN